MPKSNAEKQRDYRERLSARSNTKQFCLNPNGFNPNKNYTEEEFKEFLFQKYIGDFPKFYSKHYSYETFRKVTNA